MKIVIDIPEEQYNEIVSMYGTFPTEMKKWGLSAIKNGTPLPKGHGRLIDADAVIRRMNERIEELGDDRAIYESSAVETALNMFAPTILEADKCTYKETGCGSCKRQLDCPIDAEGSDSE